MADITNAINKFKTSVNGEDVRDGFVETMTLVNNDNIKISNDYAELEAKVNQSQIENVEIMTILVEGGII